MFQVLRLVSCCYTVDVPAEGVHALNKHIYPHICELVRKTHQQMMPQVTRSGDRRNTMEEVNGGAVKAENGRKNEVEVVDLTEHRENLARLQNGEQRIHQEKTGNVVLNENQQNGVQLAEKIYPLQNGHRAVQDQHQNGDVLRENGAKGGVNEQSGNASMSKGGAGRLNGAVNGHTNMNGHGPLNTITNGRVPVVKPAARKGGNKATKKNAKAKQAIAGGARRKKSSEDVEIPHVVFEQVRVLKFLNGLTLTEDLMARCLFGEDASKLVMKVLSTIKLLGCSQDLKNKTLALLSAICLFRGKFNCYIFCFASRNECS